MTWFIIRRLIGLVLTLWIVFTVSFLLMRAVPGGPYSGGRNLPREIEENIKHRYRLDLPLYEQYFIELKNVASGNLGMSMRLLDFDVNQVIAQGLPISAALGILALSFAVALGLSAGIVSALYRGSAADIVLMSLATVGIAVPSFVVAGLAIMLFVFVIPIFPAAGWGSFGQLILPAVCLGSVYAAEIARISRTGMLDALSQDFVRTARAKGLSHVTVALRHALPTAHAAGRFLSGAGGGGNSHRFGRRRKDFRDPRARLALRASRLSRDYSLAMGLVLLYTFLLSTLNFLVDLSYGILDPRVELK